MDEPPAARSMIRWINSPCTDPVGRVFTADGRMYRAVFAGQEALVRSMLETPELGALMDEGLVARTWASDRRLDGFGMIVETEKAPFDVPCERFTQATLRTATLRWLQISRRLLPAGYALSDAHFGNTMLFGANQPRWIDLGSIRPAPAVEAEAPFRSFRKFRGGMLAPLALLTTQPRHARLARLAIADRPYQGPLTTANEEPLAVDAFVEDLFARHFSDIAGLDAVPAMERLHEFISGLGAQSRAVSAGEAKPATAAVEALEKLLRSRPVTSIVCLGGDAYDLVPGPWRKADMLVIDEAEERLDAIGARAAAAGAGQLALWYGHPVNRRFLDRPPAADAVVAVDPLARYAHPSAVAAENLSHILGTLGRKLAIVVTPPARKAQTEQMLGHAYPSVWATGFSWLGRGPGVVTGSR